MANYKTELSRAAQKELRKIPKEDVKRIHETIRQLADDPFPDKNYAKLKHNRSVKPNRKAPPIQYRRRVGRYRVVYEVDEETAAILIMKIAHRRDVYQR